MIHKKLEIKRVLYMIAGCMIILLVTVLNISKLRTIYVLPDEFGYWTAGSFFRGYDWSDVAAMNPYYSFGYGLILAPLLWIKDSYLAYRCAIAFNGIFLCLSFLLSCHCFFVLFKTVKEEFICLISMAVVLYAGNVGISQTTMCECFLYFLFWCVFSCLIELCRKRKNKYVVLFALSLGFMYSVHLRTLGIVIAGTLCLIILLWKKVINIKQLILYILILAGVLAAGTFLKEIIQGIYSSELSSNVNDYAGQVGKVKLLLSLEGILLFIKSFCGKIWYLAGATLFLVFWFFIVCIRTMKIRTFVCKKFRLYPFMLIFLCLCFFSTLGISSLYMIVPKRIDQLIYGRYNEFILGPVLGITLCWLISKKRYLYKEAGVVFGVYALLSAAVYRFFESFSLTDINYTNIIGIYRYCASGFSVIAVSLKCLLLGIVVYLCIAVVNKRLKKKKRLSSCILSGAVIFIAAVWVWQGMGYAKERVYEYQEDLSDTQIAEIIEAINTDEEVPVYYIYNPEDTIYDKNRIFTVQLMLKEKSVNILDYDTFKENENNFEANAVFLINKNTSVVEEINYEYEVLYIGNNLQLFIDYDNYIKESIYNAVAEQKIRLPIEKAVVSLTGKMPSVAELGTVEDKGQYTINIELRLLDNPREQTVQMLLKTGDENIQDEAYIHGREIKGDTVEVSMTADIGFEHELLEIVLTGEMTGEVEVCSASVQKVSGVYDEGRDSKNELKNIGTVLNQLNIKDVVYVTYDKSIKNTETMDEIFSKIHIEHKNYGDFLNSSLTDPCIIVKIEEDIFEYQPLLGNYCVLYSNDRYFIAVSNQEEKLIQNWKKQGNSIVADDRGFSAGYLNYTSRAMGNIIILERLPIRDYKCTIEFEGISENMDVIADVEYKNGDRIQIKADSLKNNKGDILFANGLGNEEYAIIQLSQGITIKDIWLTEIDKGDFVVYMYNMALDRGVDQSGYRTWTEQLWSKQISSEDFCRIIFNSSEYMDKNVSNEEYVEDLYAVCWGEIQNDESFSEYTAMLDDDCERSEMLEIFLKSDRFIWR